MRLKKQVKFGYKQSAIKHAETTLSTILSPIGQHISMLIADL